MKRRQLITTDEAKQSCGQHKKPCSDCPWARRSLAGWLGGFPLRDWLLAAHSEERIECHTKRGFDKDTPQCAGAAIYRSNVAKLPRDPSILILPKDVEIVFATPMEFERHHAKDQ